MNDMPAIPPAQTPVRGVPDAAQDLAAAIFDAILGPGRFLARLPQESHAGWQTRAVLAVLADRLDN